MPIEGGECVDRSTHTHTHTYLLRRIIWKTAWEREECWLADVVPEVLRNTTQSTVEPPNNGHIVGTSPFVL